MGQERCAETDVSVIANVLPLGLGVGWWWWRWFQECPLHFLKVNKKQAIYGPMVYLCQLANLKAWKLKINVFENNYLPNFKRLLSPLDGLLNTLLAPVLRASFWVGLGWPLRVHVSKVPRSCWYCWSETVLWEAQLWTNPPSLFYLARHAFLIWWLQKSDCYHFYAFYICSSFP